MPNQLWIVYALLGALFAGVVQVMSKPAGDKLGPNPVSLIRSVVMVVFFVGVVAWQIYNPKPAADSSTSTEATRSANAISWNAAIALAIGAGVASSLSWFFGYAALRLSAVANSYSIDKLSLIFGVALAVIFLRERPSLPNYLGIALMVGGAYLVTLKPVR